MDRAELWAQRWEQTARLVGIQRRDLAHLGRLTLPGRQLLAHFLLAFRSLGQQHGAGLPVPDRRLAQVGQRVDEPGIGAGGGAGEGVPVRVLHPGGPGADDPCAGGGRPATDIRIDEGHISAQGCRRKRACASDDSGANDNQAHQISLLP